VAGGSPTAALFCVGSVNQPMRDTGRLETVCEALLTRGYELERADRHAVAVPTDGTDPIGVPGELRVVPAPPRLVGILEAVARAVERDRTALFVAHPVDAATVQEVLTDPPALAARTANGREFYSVPDRLRAGEAGLACCRASEPPVWRERPADGITADGSRVVLYADGEPVTAFESVADLSCPSATAFGYAYRRDESGRFEVRNLEDDRTAGRFVSVREMKANAYQPVPVPLVPERLLGDAHLPETWTLATVEDGRVTSVEGA